MIKKKNQRKMRFEEKRSLLKKDEDEDEIENGAVDEEDR